MSTKPGRYYAKYLVATVEDAVALVCQFEQGMLSSFGKGDDQWEGIDMTDPGATVTIVTRPPSNYQFRYGMVEVNVLVPVEEVPKDYWLSPWCAEDIVTFNEAGGHENGEAHSWGMWKAKGDKNWGPM